MRMLAVVPALVLAGCVPTPPDYAVPPQHAPIGGAAPVDVAEFVRATQPDAETFFIKDVKGLEGGTWRWTYSEPEFRFTLKSVLHRKFHMEFSVHGTTFRDTGPLRMVILINGQPFDQIVYDSPGEKVYEKSVPASMLRPGTENRVLVQVLNPWLAPDGVKLGFLLQNAGFTGP